MSNKIYLSFSVIFMLFFLVSCGKNHQKKHVVQQIEQIKKSIAPMKKPPMKNEFVAHKYDANEAIKLRSPFETSQPIVSANEVKSNNPLLLYPLSMLKFVGTLSKENTTKAYILTPDNKILTTSLGEVIGTQRAKVIKINNRQMELLLQTIEPGKPMKQQIITLDIKGGST